MWFEVPGIKIHQRVPENGRDKKWKKAGVTKIEQLRHIGQTNP
jgi:hypothetical protein